MINKIPKGTPVYISAGVTDMRKSICGLAAIIQGSFGMDPFCGAFFVFCNRDKNKIKIVFWDKDGFVLYYKRRERGRFVWPAIDEAEGDTVGIKSGDLDRLLAGLSMEQFIPHRNYAAI
jgi:transposase